MESASDLTVLVTARGDIEVWDATTSRRLFRLPSTTSNPVYAFFNEASEVVAVTGDGAMRTYDVETARSSYDLIKTWACDYFFSSEEDDGTLRALIESGNSALAEFIEGRRGARGVTLRC